MQESYKSKCLGIKCYQLILARTRPVSGVTEEPAVITLEHQFYCRLLDNYKYLTNCEFD